MSEHITVVIKMPENEQEKNYVRTSLSLIQSYITVTSPEDCVTILDMLEQNKAFDLALANEARSDTLERHTEAELVQEIKQKIINRPQKFTHIMR